MTGRAGRVDPIPRKVDRTARPPDGGEVVTTAFISRGQVTRLGEPIALRLVLDHGAMAGLAFGSDSIWAVHGRPFLLVASEPSG